MALSAALRDRGVRWIGGGWLAFLTENLVLSHNREEIIARIGDDRYHQIYNTLSTCACASILYGYTKYGRGKGPLLWDPRRPALRAGALVFQALGLVGFSQLLPKLQVPVTLTRQGPVGVELVATTPHTTPPATTAPSASVSHALHAAVDTTAAVSGWRPTARCPMDFAPKDVPADGVYGLKRVTRHPTFWSLGFLGLGTALGSPFAPEVVMFAFPALFAAVGGSHQDYRYRRGWGGKLTPEVDAKTSGLPFVALLSGRQSWRDLLDELKLTNAALAVLVALSLHRRRLMRVL